MSHISYDVRITLGRNALTDKQLEMTGDIVCEVGGIEDEPWEELGDRPAPGHRGTGTGGRGFPRRSPRFPLVVKETALCCPPVGLESAELAQRPPY